MLSESLAFIHALLGRTHQGYVTLTAMHPEADQAPPSRHISVDDKTGLSHHLADLLDCNAQGWGAFVGIGLRKTDLGRWRRGGKADVATLLALVADIDRPCLPYELGFLPPPSCVVHSGRGHHVYWYLEPTHELALADRILAGLATYLASDVMTSAQSMRLPGSINTKAGCGRLCHILEHHPHQIYALKTFRFLALPKFRPLPVRHHSVEDGLAEAISQVLLEQYGGYFKDNGWLAAECPLAHAKDKPGLHFGYNPDYGVGHCFGRHGTLGTGELAHILHVK